MRAKTFSIFTISIFVIAIIMLFLTNLLANQLWYHGLKSDWEKGQLWGGDGYGFPEYKTRYISQKKLNYNAFIFGGSKSSSIHPSYLNRFSKNKFYNYWTNGGCFKNYEMFINYIFKKYNSIDEIIICLSSSEVEHFEPYWKIIPSNIKGYPFAKEITNIKLFKEKYLNINTFIELYKKRNLQNLEPLTDSDGSRSSELYFNKYKENPEKYIKERVLPYWHLRDGGWEKTLEELFFKTRQLAACKENISSLERIKQLCERRNIKLTVIVMPTFVGEISKYMSPEFEQYLKRLTNIVPLYNFGGINDINMNPNNFCDGGHFFDFVGDKIIEELYNPYKNTYDFDVFGILLTEDNIENYIASQKAKWNKLKEEYENTGEIKLNDLDSPSYLGPPMK